ncbi:MAG: NAD(P)H-hydrate dehydratase [Bacteroidales bacterium]|nr:NAD(P)H-hydrate dehydratase [Bacteroidales bacterium]
MKIFPVGIVREADAYTIAHEPVASIDLMERAASRCYDWILRKLSGRTPRFYIFCGPGNNGGDGLALARMLHDISFEVQVCIPSDKEKYSPDFSINLKKLKCLDLEPVFLQEGLHFAPEPGDIIIDALFGSGLSKSVEGIEREVINHINKLQAIVISIDIPSGLFADKAILPGASVVHADYTLSFQFPKLSFFLSENELFVGDWVVLPIGLHEEFIRNQACNHYFLTKQDIQEIIKPRKRFSHKGTYGHALMIAGSHGKIGAAILASKSCLRSGVGLLTSHVPVCGYEILQTTVPEAMISVDPGQNDCSGIPDLSPYSAIGAGPGLGRSREAHNTIRLLLQEAKVPLVLDADALNILAEQKTWQAFIPAGSILTPHPKEFERLAGKWNNGFELLDLLGDYALRQKVYIILKGAFTIICTPGGNYFFNPSGNPGMATGGSGDVLTGLLTGLLAQNYSPLDACLLGVYLHGHAGDLASLKTGQEALLAGDIIDHIGPAFQDTINDSE